MRWDDASIRALRPSKPAVDPTVAHGVLDEIERTTRGPQRARTVFLAGAECAFTCLFCDLWRYTTDAPTPPGAIPRQLAAALAEMPAGTSTLKLYNASNFFDRRAIPEEDLPAIAEAAAPFDRVVVECHPRLVDERAVRFSSELEPRLEVALGLETMHPEALAGLNKKMTVEDFRRAAAYCRGREIAVRAFVLIGAPGVPPAEAIAWIERSVRLSADSGANQVALIPLRTGQGALGELVKAGEHVPPTVREIEHAFEAALAVETSSCVVTLDTWDLGVHAGSECCKASRLARLRAMNTDGALRPAIDCGECGP